MSPTVPELLVEWDRRRRDGTPVSVAELCIGRPADLADLRQRASRLEECDRLLGLAGPPPTPDEPVPDRIGEYQIRGVLGRGGMGVVYDGWDPGLKRAAAVKVLRPTAAYRPFVRTGELRARFDRESEVLGRLDHEHLVPVYGSGVSDGRPYIAMALLAGGSARDRAEGLTRLGPRAVAAFVARVADGVHAAHALGVLHRDLKPANILLTAAGDPRVSDFGLARFWSPGVVADPDETWGGGEPTGSGAADLTFPGVQPGTPAYMAPEQFDPSRGPVGPATDVWALGVILFEMVSGRRPFVVADDRPLAAQVCGTLTPRCRSTHGRVPGWLRAVIDRSLAKDPAERYQTAADLATALRAGLRAGRRRAWVAGTVGLLGLVLAIGVAGGRLLRADPPPVPVAATATRFEDLPDVQRALADLAAGKEVVLVDENKRALYRWVWEEQTGRAGKVDGQSFYVHSRWPGPTPVEFLPGLPAGRFRVRARLRHDEGATFSTVALYVDGRSWRSGAGQHLACTWLEFADYGTLAAKPAVPWAANSDARLQMVCLTDSPRSGVRPPVRMDEVGRAGYVSAAAQNRPAGYRTVELVVGTAAIEGRWAESVLGPVGADTIRGFVSDCRRRYPPNDLGEPSPEPGRGGIGLVIYNGQVSVADLRVTPVAE